MANNINKKPQTNRKAIASRRGRTILVVLLLIGGFAFMLHRMYWEGFFELPFRRTKNTAWLNGQLCVLDKQRDALHPKTAPSYFFNGTPMGNGEVGELKAVDEMQYCPKGSVLLVLWDDRPRRQPPPFDHADAIREFERVKKTDRFFRVVYVEDKEIPKQDRGIFIFKIVVPDLSSREDQAKQSKYYLNETFLGFGDAGYQTLLESVEQTSPKYFIMINDQPFHPCGPLIIIPSGEKIRRLRDMLRERNAIIINGMEF